MYTDWGVSYLRKRNEEKDKSKDGIPYRLNVIESTPKAGNS